MARYIVRQIISLIPIVLAITMFAFALMHMAPGDPAILLAPETATAEDIELLRERMGLNRPIYEQYVQFLARVVKGDLGQSYYFGEPVTEIIREVFPATIELAIFATLIALLIAVPIGIFAALRRNTVLDNVAMSAALFGVSLPNFWFGILLIMLFSANLGWLPVSGRIGYGVALKSMTGLYSLDSILTLNWQALKDSLRHMILPAVALAGSPAAAWSRLVRSSMLEVVGFDYVRTARAKGLPERAIILKHAFRNALIPVVTMIGVQMRTMLGGSIVVETVFSFPGLGDTLIRAINHRDYFLVLGIVTVFSITALLVNLCVDLSYAFIDPRVRYD